MDIQNFINLMSENNKLKAGSEYNLGRLIEDLEKCDQELIIKFDDCKKPLEFDSWRGSYDCLSLTYETQDWRSDDDDFFTIKVKDILHKAKEALGKEFTGYKGGDFIMDKSTPIYVANYGESSSPKYSCKYHSVSIKDTWKISGINICDDKVIMQTKICDVYGSIEDIVEDIKNILVGQATA